MKNVHIPLTENNTTSNAYFSIDEKLVNCINNNIITLLATPTNTRILNPDFGIIAYQYLGEPKVNRVLELIKQDIIEKFKKYISNAKLLKVEIIWNDDKTALLSGSWIYTKSTNNLEQNFKFLVK